MSSGIFGENFPYTNFHDLNMDWIIKIVKDFLEQYNTIQEAITNGVTEISDTTAEKLEDLDAEATRLTNLLNQWYSTHSAQIQSEFEDALEQFSTTAEQVAEQAIASIPSDYTELSNNVRVAFQNLKINNNITEQTELEIIGLTLGKTLSSGVYQDAPSPVANMRAASKFFYVAGDYLEIDVTNGKVEIDFYDDDYNYVNYDGWITSHTIIKSRSTYFRVLVGGDSSIETSYENIATIKIHSNTAKVFDSTNKLIAKIGSQIPLNGWIEGLYPNPSSGAIWSGEDYKYVPMVDIIGGAKYRYTGILNSACGIVFYDKNRTMIPNSGISITEFTAPDNACYANIGAKGLSTTPYLYCIGYDWSIDGNHTETVEFTQISGVRGPSASTTETGAHAEVNVTPGQSYMVSGYTYVLNTFPLVVFFNDSTYVDYVNGSEGNNRNVIVTVPENVNTMVVNGKPYEIYISKCATNVKEGIDNLFQKSSNLFNFEHKNIVWFGTSIPANGWFGSEHPNAYPQQVGRLIDANVINEAIGSSSIFCKDPALITTDNPYGFMGNFEGCSRCLTNSLEEMQWIIDHYDSSIWTSHAPSSMDSWLANEIKNCSYERKLDKYLTANTMPDLFVFDHGFNDSTDVNNYYDTYGEYNTYCFRGGMNFLIKRILDFNPYANIVIIGNYTTTRDVPEMQETVARDWAIPIYKQWEYLGLSLTQDVTATGYWNDTENGYVWIEDGTPRTYSMRDRLVPDSIHPWSNPTGKVTKKMAELIAKWLTTNVIPYID